MFLFRRCSAALALIAALPLIPTVARSEVFRVATYNVESYLDAPTKTRHSKSEESKARVRESICAIKPDVLALQEMGGANALLELRAALKSAGRDFPYWDHVQGFDTNIHVALLSRFPLIACRSHTNEAFLLSGRRYRVSRGIGEWDIQVNSNYVFTLITAHLKSKRAIGGGDEAEMRFEEAKVLREKIEERLAENPEANLVVLGDFNDTRDSPSIKAIIGRGRHKLTDTRPAERNGDPAGEPGRAERNITWTHYFPKEDTYSRIDYILLSAGMAREWAPSETYVLALPNWGRASDHRPLVAAFEARNN